MMLGCGVDPKVPQDENLGLDATALKLQNCSSEIPSLLKPEPKKSLLLGSNPAQTRILEAG